jgi:hypothetical protein
MAAIDLSFYPLPRKVEGDKIWIWDPVRKKKLLYRPEERVRQQFISFLLYGAEISANHIGVEIPLKNEPDGKAMRADLVIWGSEELEPELIAEIKAPEVELNLETVSQLQKYQRAFQAPWWAILNGEEWFLWRKDREMKRFVPERKLALTGYKSAFPGFQLQTLREILDEPLFRRDPEAWFSRKNTRGLAWDLDPELAFRALSLYLLLLNSQEISAHLTINHPGGEYVGHTYMEFSDSSDASFWNNTYTFLKFGDINYALAVGPGIDWRAAVFIVTKTPDGKFSEQIITLKQLFEHLTEENRTESDSFLALDTLIKLFT